jgi:hypothetical protein
MMTTFPKGTGTMGPPTGLAFSCRERAVSFFQKHYDLAREAVSWNAVLGGNASATFL